MPRAIILVLDSLGIGATPDAVKFGDQGSNTLGHIADWCASGNHYKDRLDGPLRLPMLSKLGLGKAGSLVTGAPLPGFDYTCDIIGSYAACQEVSSGKDTPSGHWEIAGLPVTYDWGYFPVTDNCFPQSLLNAIIDQSDITGTLGNCHASGTEILKELGEEHIQTGHPIFYTSADSVIQIAAHEEHFGLDRLLELCEIIRELVNEYNIGRVIARPFLGSTPHDFKRTGNRRDIATPPHDDTLLDKIIASGQDVYSIGKIADIFAHRGINHKVKATGHDALFDATVTALKEACDGSLIFTNFVEFDQTYGHRRNVGGYAAELEHFDNRIGEVMDAMRPDDLLVLTADHGCDPTWPGSDHTREHVPFVAYSPTRKTSSNLGIRSTFADIGQTIAGHLGISPLSFGTDAFSVGKKV